jgi:hypothetical protein
VIRSRCGRTQTDRTRTYRRVPSVAKRAAANKAACGLISTFPGDTPDVGFDLDMPTAYRSASSVRNGAHWSCGRILLGRPPLRSRNPQPAHAVARLGGPVVMVCPLGRVMVSSRLGPSSMVQPLWMQPWWVVQSGMRLIRSVFPPSRQYLMWWGWVNSIRTRHPGTAHVAYIAWSARRWARLASLVVRSRSSSPSGSSTWPLLTTTA